MGDRTEDEARPATVKVLLKIGGPGAYVYKLQTLDGVDVPFREFGMPEDHAEHPEFEAFGKTAVQDEPEPPRGWVNTVGDEWERFGREIYAGDILLACNVKGNTPGNWGYHHDIKPEDLRFLAYLLEAKQQKGDR